jgi:hypothetical protein
MTTTRICVDDLVDDMLMTTFRIRVDDHVEDMCR